MRIGAAEALRLQPDPVHGLNPIRDRQFKLPGSNWTPAASAKLAAPPGPAGSLTFDLRQSPREIGSRSVICPDSTPVSHSKEWTMQADYRIDRPDELLSPSLVLFKPLLERNLDQMIRVAGGTGRLRPHCKTHKMEQVTRLELARGITKHKAATIAEIEMLLNAGARDIVLGYNPIGPAIGRIAKLLAAFPDLQLCVTGDDPAPVAALGAAVHAVGRVVQVAVDLNTGMNRTGLEIGPAAIELYRLIVNTPGLAAGGLHCYDGHIQAPERSERDAIVRSLWDRVSVLRSEIEQRGWPIPRLICGGSSTLPVYAAMTDPLIELAAGTTVLHDTGYGDRFHEPEMTGFHPATLVLTRVVSRPNATRITVDCGNKSVSPDQPMAERVRFPDVPDGKTVMHSEEHLVLETSHRDRFAPGDVLLGVPRHICTTINMHDWVYVIDDGKLVDQWPITARRRVLTV